jgi:hypothetical protein
MTNMPPHYDDQMDAIAAALLAELNALTQAEEAHQLRQSRSAAEARLVAATRSLERLKTAVDEEKSMLSKGVESRRASLLLRKKFDGLTGTK